MGYNEDWDTIEPGQKVVNCAPAAVEEYLAGLPAAARRDLNRALSGLDDHSSSSDESESDPEDPDFEEEVASRVPRMPAIVCGSGPLHGVWTQGVCCIL